MNTSKRSSLLSLIVVAVILCSCSGSGPSGLTGTYTGKNSLGYSYSINFISDTDCIVSDPRRGQGPATYKVVKGHVLLSIPGGGAADLVMTGNTLALSDGGYNVTLTKQ